MDYNGSRKYLPPIAVIRQRMVLAVGSNGVYLMQSGEVFDDFKLSFNLSHEEIDGYPFTIHFRKQDHQNYERLFWNTHDLMVGHVHCVDGVLEAQAEDAGTLVPNTDAMRLMYSNPGGIFSFRMWDHNLSDSQLNDLYTLFVNKYR